MLLTIWCILSFLGFKKLLHTTSGSFFFPFDLAHVLWVKLIGGSNSEPIPTRVFVDQDDKESQVLCSLIFDRVHIPLSVIFREIPPTVYHHLVCTSETVGDYPEAGLGKSFELGSQSKQQESFISSGINQPMRVVHSDLRRLDRPVPFSQDSM
jgi:hypothetical protein